MNRVPATALAAALLAGLTVLTAAPAAAQNPRPVNRGPAAEQARPLAPRGALRADLAAPYDGNAEETRRRLYEVLQQYPPSLREVLRLDPSLLTNPAYLEPYPALAEFLDAAPRDCAQPRVLHPGFPPVP